MNSKSIVITGASGGIGMALVKKFLRCSNYDVIAISRNITTLELLQQEYPNLQIIQADINNDVDRRNIFALINNKIISVINNAAYSGTPIAFKDMKIEELHLFFETNFFAPLTILQYLLDHNKVEKVLNISSGAAQIPQNKIFGYCTSKAAIHYAFECLKLEYPNTKFSNLRPGMVDTKLQEQWRNNGENIFDSGSLFLKAKQDNLLIPAEKVANFVYQVFQTSNDQFSSKYWNIYDDLDDINITSPENIIQKEIIK
jgi:short-subunit dehydrogenase